MRRAAFHRKGESPLAAIMPKRFLIHRTVMYLVPDCEHGAQRFEVAQEKVLL